MPDIVLPHAAQHFVLQEMILTITERNERLLRLDNELLYRVKAWRPQVRLCICYAYMSKRGKNYNVIMVAIAREMVAFIWLISREVVLPTTNVRS
jgi:hypothetical protein